MMWKAKDPNRAIMSILAIIFSSMRIGIGAFGLRRS